MIALDPVAGKQRRGDSVWWRRFQMYIGNPSISFVGLQWIQDSNNQVIIYRLHFFVKVGWAPNPLNKLYSYRKPSIKPPRGGGGYLFQTNLREGGQHNLVRTMVSVPHKELELQSVKAQVQWL